MSKFFSKASLVIASAVALFGVTAGNTIASVSDVSEKSPLYLEHGKTISGGSIVYDHYSHSSHGSHVSHGSGY